MSLDVLGRLGKLRDVLGWCGTFLYVFGCFLMFWWCFWGCSGTYWDIMDWNVHGVFWNLLGQFGMVLDSQGHFGRFCDVLGVYWDVSGCLETF